MISRELEIQGVQEIRLDYRSDIRGGFVKTYHEDLLQKASIFFQLKEQYYSISNKNVIRGMHFQIPPFACSKLVTVLSGEILDVVLDLRKYSSTYGKYITVPMSAESPSCLFIPVGCAHGFLSLTDHTCMLYNVSELYNAECDTGIRWDSFGYEWPLENPILSERDRQLPALNAFNNTFQENTRNNR